MMATFISWVRTLVIASFLITFVKLLLPEGALRPYVRLVLHFVLLAVFIQPLASLGGQRITLSSWFHNTASSGTVADTDRWVQLGQQIQADSRQLTEDYVSQHVALQIETFVGLVAGVDAVQVNDMRVADESIQYVALTIDGDKERAERQVLNVLQVYFALDPGDIMMNWQSREESIHANME